MLFKIMPGLKQLIHYNQANLTDDLTAGITVAILLIPQSMAYAIIAGMPITSGLFAATFPLLIYALFGNSRYLSVGPVSIVSLLAFTSLSGIVQAESMHLFELMITLSLLIGVVQAVLGFLKFGSIFKYVSPAVMNGFISAAAFIIGLNQVKTILGVSLPPYENFLDYIFVMFNKLSESNPFTIGLGVGSILVLLLIKKYFFKSLGPFIVIISSVIIVEYFKLSNVGVAIVGDIPRELPSVSLGFPTLDILLLLLPIAGVIAFISFIESYAVARTLAEEDKEQLNPNHELFSLGLSNVTSSLVSAFPVSGAISRTAVNHQSGAKSNLSLVVTAFFMMTAIFFLTPFFYFLPKATLGAIIITAVSGLINLKPLVYYLRNVFSDAIVFLITFLTTLLIDIFMGVIIGLFFSLLITAIKRWLI